MAELFIEAQGLEEKVDYLPRVEKLRIRKVRNIHMGADWATLYTAGFAVGLAELLFSQQGNPVPPATRAVAYTGIFALVNGIPMGALTWGSYIRAGAERGKLSKQAKEEAGRIIPGKYIAKTAYAIGEGTLKAGMWTAATFSQPETYRKIGRVLAEGGKQWKNTFKEETTFGKIKMVGELAAPVALLGYGISQMF